MSLTTYCDFDEVRSALGVNDLELKDTVLGLPVYEMGLIRELNKVSTSLNAAFSNIVSKPTGDRTANEAALHNAARLFSVYAVARQVGVSLANFAPKDVSDGKASVSRFSSDPFDKVMARIDALQSSLRVDLGLAFVAYSGSTSTRVASTTPATMFRASPRGFDPVTGA